MIPIEQAKKIIQDHSLKNKKEMVDLPAAFGRFLAEDITAPIASPSFTNSSMDGYAFAWSEVASKDGKRPFELNIVGESCAGAPFLQKIPEGSCVVINTGAMLPEGTDTVVPVEDTRRKGDIVRLTKKVQSHQFVRFEGAEFEQGEIILKKGDKLDPARIAQLASVGIKMVSVYATPRVALVLTGSELVAYDQPAKKYQVRDANGIMLESAIQLSGGELLRRIYVGDDLKTTVAALREAEKDCQIVIFSGGVSVGPHDHVKAAAEQAGYKELFWRVSQKPGKPLFFAKKEERLLFGLPGNPVSSYMNFILYLYPLLHGMVGGSAALPVVRGELARKLFNKGERTQFYRVRIEQKVNKKVVVDILDKLESYMISSVALADGFITVDKNQTIEKGAVVDVQLLPWRM